MGAVFGKIFMNSSDRSPKIDLSSDKAACLLDPDLKSFDSKLCDLTRQSINSLAASVKVRSPSDDRSLSLDCVTLISNNFSEVNKEVVKVIEEQKEEIWKNKQLHDLVDEYFRISCKILDFCTAIEEDLNRAANSQLSIQLAVKQFDEEQQGYGGVGGSDKKLYSRTLKSLEKFKMDDEIFTKEFFNLLTSLHNDLVSMRKKLEERESNLDKKLKSRNTWKWVSGITFTATSVLLLVCAAVAAAVAAPLVLIALAAASNMPMIVMGEWLNSILEKYENEVKGERDLISLMRRKSSIAIWELECIRSDVLNLKTKIKDLSQDVEFAIGEEDPRAVVMVIDEIRKKSTKFIQATRDLRERNEECRRHTRKAMDDVLAKMKKYPGT